ncbi:MAG: hypothetical protein HY716_03695 [Planctomycetes bacterium]|nr:hypothetical protein [Planctomycetota bacterium]
MKTVSALAILSFTASSCGRPSTELSVGIIGGPGSGAGQFATPRAAAWDPRGWLYVVDKTGRVQKFDAGGRFLLGWTTPEIERGRPTGLAVDPLGDVLVADTHYHRILRYSSDGRLLDRFGSEGRGPGQFVYPVGLAVTADGTIYVAEFGGNDRIQVFAPDGTYRRGWGRYGEAPGEFKRPQGIALGERRLYVADAANHRIQVFTPEGRWIASWGGVRYPYSVSIDPRGKLLVAEYGTHRITKFSPEGRPLGSVGGAGRAPGELDTPWAAVAAGDEVFVVDSGNHRVQRWPARRWMGQ